MSGAGHSELNEQRIPVPASDSGQTGAWQRFCTHCRPSEQSTDVRHSSWQKLLRQTSPLGHCEVYVQACPVEGPASLVLIGSPPSRSSVVSAQPPATHFCSARQSASPWHWSRHCPSF